MKSLLRSFTAGVLLVFSPVARADDKLITVDPASGLITVDQRGSLKSFRVKPFTEITINGVKASIGQLRPNMMLTFALADAQTVSKISARGNPTQAGGTPPPGTTRRVTIKLAVDGSDTIKIGGGRLWIEHGDAKKPIAISVNGVKWEPVWNGSTSEAFIGFSGGLAPFGAEKVSVRQGKGRGQTKIVEPPTDQNQQTLSFHIQDGGNGADEYEVRITW